MMFPYLVSVQRESNIHAVAALLCLRLASLALCWASPRLLRSATLALSILAR